MRLTFYQSPLCPRCYMAGKNLEALQQEIPNIQIEKVDVVLNFSRTRQDGIALFPAIKVEDQTLSGIFLSKEKISEFLTQFIDSKP